MIYRFVLYALTYCATLLDYNFWKENAYKIMLDFIVYFDGKYITTWNSPIYHLHKQIS